MAQQDLLSRVHLALFVITVEKYLKYSKFSISFYLPCPVLGLVAFSIILRKFFFSSILISIAKHLPISVIVLMMSCSINFSLTRSTRSSAYYTVRNSFPAIWKSLNFQHLNKIFFVQFEYNRPTRHWHVLFQHTGLHAGIHREKDR